MDEPTFCIMCGVRPVGDGRVKTCSPKCWEVFHGLAHMEWPVILGTSIRRVWLRAEVAGLVERVGASLACVRPDWPTDAFDALDALARLAGGGA